MAGGVQRQEWDVCARCGFVHPIGMLSMQLGKKLCKCHGCFDDLTNYYRQQVIAEKLATGEEGKSDKPETFVDPQELTF
jgi:hypothetical protein